MPERRQEPRYVVDWPAEVLLGERRVAGRLINVSESGALLALGERSFEPGHRALVVLRPVDPSGEPVVFEAQVRWGASMGTVFGFGLALPVRAVADALQLPH